MIYLGVLVGLCIMVAIIRLAVDKDSNLPTRIAALIAFALMVITIIICVIIVFTDNRVPVDPSVLIVGAPVEVKEKGNNNFWLIFLLIIFLISVFSVVVFLAMKENKKQAHKSDNNGSEAPKNLVF